MAKYSMKQGGKEVGPASVYAEPHTMTGKKVTAAGAIGKGKNEASLDSYDLSVGNVRKGSAPAPKTSGIKIRGTGAATKGVMARGPMA
jgi:hypothetical protein